ncbi:hypothetical protein H4R35_006377 [Dimargaris xerosporica]|nr:hypothetical protein H4R35_006377 [Dimargaris xerosporica]
MLGLDRKAMETQYLQDPTISNKAKQEFHALRQADPTAEPQKFNKYLWRQLQFRWDCKLLPIVWGLSPSQKANMVIDNLPHDVINLGELYLQQAQVLAPHTIAGNPTPLDLTLYPDIFKGLPVASRPDYEDVANRFQQFIGPKAHQVFSDIEHGFLGAFNAGYVMEIPNLVKKYVEIINQVDLLPFIQQRHAEPIYGILAKDIAHNDPDRIRYFFNDIMAFHVIPKLIMAHVAKGYYNQVLAFINEMLESKYLKKFFDSIKVDTSLNYYERAAYMALRQPMDKNTTKFLKQSQKRAMPEFRVNRLYQCDFGDNQHDVVKHSLESIFDKALLQAQVGEGECQRFSAQFDPQDMKKQYLQDPTVPKANEQQHSELQQPDPLAANAQFNKYFWRHLQFRWDHGLLSRSSGLGSSQQYITVDVVIDNFQNNLVNLCRLYLQSAPYLEAINKDDLHLPLQALQQNAVYDIFIKVIALEDPARVQYFFNDIITYQVIPNFVMAHVGKGYYSQALAFINRMQTNPYLSELFNRIPADGYPNYHEQAI